MGHRGRLRRQRGQATAGLRALHGQQRPLLGDVLHVDRRRAGGRRLQGGQGRGGVGGVGDHEELLLPHPPHDQVVDHRGVVVEQVGVLRPARADPAEVVGQKALEGVERAGTPKPDRPHVGDVEDHRARPAGPVLVEDAPVPDRHVPAGEVDHATAEGAVLRVEGAVAAGL